MRLFALCLVLALASGCAEEPLRPTDFDAELTQIDQRIAAASGTPGEAAQAAGLRYARATLTGLPADSARASEATTRAMAIVGQVPDLLLLRAALDLHEHRWQEAAQLFAQAPALGETGRGRLLRADIDLQQGRYAAARAACVEAVARERSWSTLVRLAQMKALDGDTDAADALYAEAEEDITAKEMRAYAWVLLQRGWLQFSRGRYDRAAAHYAHAERAYSGYWLTDDYMGELLAAQGQFDAAVARYQRLAARVPRPDLQQRLGDLYTFMGRPADAAPWHALALKGYLDATSRGDVQYLHHLTAFYADVKQDGAEAVAWARRDLQARENAAALDALAWALHRGGRQAEAFETSTRALKTGIRDAHTLAHAATIAIAAGHADAGRALLREAAAYNPRYEDFHVHR